MELLEGAMSPSVSLESSVTNRLPRTEARTVPTSIRLLNRLSGIRNPSSTGETAAAGHSAPVEPRATVVKAQPGSSTGDLLETLPDLEAARKQQEQAKEKRIDLPLIHSRLEVQLLPEAQRAAREAYDPSPTTLSKVDIRV
jgi:hypothetical protein